jgi:hypothetical protein
MPRFVAVCLLLILAACSNDAARWTKAGVDEDRISADLEGCRSEARAATRRDAQIDADILASRGNDWQRAGTLGMQQDQMSANRRGNANSIIARCMAEKGYTRKD